MRWCTITYVEMHQSLRKVRRLTHVERIAIRLQYEAGARQVDLAEAFQVNQSTISRVLARREEAA